MTGAPREIPITVDEVTIGRGHDNVVVLQGALVSRRHARVLATSKGFMLVDADSANGVWLGAQRIRHHFLASGEVFRVGEWNLEYHDAPDSTAATMIAPVPPLAGPGPIATPRQVVPPPLPIPAPPAEPGGTLCARCGAVIAARSRICGQCGTGLSARPRPSRAPLWIGLGLLLCGVGVVATVGYHWRAVWLPIAARWIGSRSVESDSRGTPPELAPFGALARPRGAPRSLALGPAASRHPLDPTVALSVPAGALEADTQVLTSVVDIAAGRAPADVQSAAAYVVSAPDGTRLRQPLVLEIAAPADQVSVAEAYGDGWAPLELPPGPGVRVPIDHFSRRTFAVVRWQPGRKAAPAQEPVAILLSDAVEGASPPLAGDTQEPLEARTQVPLPPPRRPGPLDDDPGYRQFTGKDMQRNLSGRTELCADLTERVRNFPGVSFDLPQLGGAEAPRPEAGLPAGTPFEQLMIAAVDPKEQSRNPYVRLTNDDPGDGDPRSREQRLEEAILASGGDLTPADVMELALRACNGNYLTATLTAHNLLKNVAYQGRQQTALVSGLRARGRTDVAFPTRLGNLADKLANLRANPGDKMGIWYHAFVPLTIAAWTNDPSEADWAITQEYFVRWLGSLTNMGSPMDAEKQQSDRCFARSAWDISGVKALQTPQTRPPAPPPPPPPPPPTQSPSASPSATPTWSEWFGVSKPTPTPCGPNPPVPRKCPWTPDGYSVGACGSGFCWDGGPQGSLACKQENGVEGAGRTYTSDLACGEGLTAERDPCTNVILRCVKK